MTTDASRTTAATLARMRASEEKSAEKLRGRGWFAWRTGSVPSPKLFEEREVYATDAARQTFRVLGWEAGLPILEGSQGETFLGPNSYVFTVGPK